MRILKVVQGTREWHAARAKFNCASDAAAMMGVSKHMSRTELVRVKATGDEREFSEWAKKNLLEKGHEIERKARAMVEDMIGEDLFPVVGVDDDKGLLASFDGLNMDGDTGFECKMWNEELVAAMRTGDLPPAWAWQPEQQIMVGGLERVLFVCTDGTRERFEMLEYRSKPERASQLLPGWAQLGEDVKSYVHVEDKPKPAAAAVTSLPVVLVNVDIVDEQDNVTGGRIAVSSNLKVFGETLKAFIDGLNKAPATDQEFAESEAAIRTLQTAQDALEAAKQRALAQTTSIDEMCRMVDGYAETARQTRLMLDKLVTARKQAVRAEILQGGKDQLAQHIEALNKRLGLNLMPVIAADFAGVMKSKRTVSSLRDAVNTELARAKIDANAVADNIQVNLATVRAAAYSQLFPDLAQIVLKKKDDLDALVRLRVTEHEAAEQRMRDEAREQILAEERARVEAAERARLEAEQRAAAAPPAAAPSPISAVASVISQDALHARQGENRFYREPAPTGQLFATAPAARDQYAAPEERPRDVDIVNVLTNHYQVSEHAVLKWLLEMDLEAVTQELADEASV